MLIKLHNTAGHKETWYSSSSPWIFQVMAYRQYPNSCKDISCWWSVLYLRHKSTADFHGDGIDKGLQFFHDNYPHTNSSQIILIQNLHSESSVISTRTICINIRTWQPQVQHTAKTELVKRTSYRSTRLFSKLNTRLWVCVPDTPTLNVVVGTSSHLNYILQSINTGGNHLSKEQQSHTFIRGNIAWLWLLRT